MLVKKKRRELVLSYSSGVRDPEIGDFEKAGRTGNPAKMKQVKESIRQRIRKKYWYTEWEAG